MIRDTVFVAGMAIALYGTWQYDSRVVFILGGLILAAFGGGWPWRKRGR